MSKRISDGERRITLKLAEAQGELAIARVRIEQLQEMVSGLAAAINRILETPPFVGEKSEPVA